MMILNWIFQIQSYLNSYSRYIRYRWMTSLIFAAVLAILIWFYGSQLSIGTWHPFATARTRLFAVVAIGIGWLVYIGMKLFGARRADRKLIDAVTDDKADPQRAAAEDVAELRGRLRDALKTLRKSLGRGSVYQLPWYLLIGAPGAGKTTALVNSGLHFPLANEGGGGPQPIQGVAGTRHCDWWFTNEAVLIDTAGRYTSQDGEQETDKAGWIGFLKLLQKNRRRQPLNGALVILGLDDIMNADPAERLKQGRVIRKRLRELDETFKLRVPAYIVLTKADRLAGFNAYFENLDRSTREQVWGVTLPLPASGVEGGDLADRFGHALDALVERLNALMLDRLQSEQDSERRAEIFAFPSQVALIAEPLHEMLGELAAASRFDPPPRIRGIYLASAQQDQAPLDLVTRAAVTHFGVELPRLAEATIAGNKSYFLARLLKEVVFGEASLISTDPLRERRNRIIRWAGAAAVGVVTLVVCASWGADFLRQESQLASTEARVAVYAPDAQAIKVKQVTDRDFAAVDRLLDQAAAISAPYEGSEKARRLGLPTQYDKVHSGYENLYTRALNSFLLPRLLIQVEADMKPKPELAAYVNDNVRVYPMLGSRLGMDEGFARKTLEEDLQRALPGQDKAQVRASLIKHVAALVARPLAPITLDDGLLKEALANEHSRDLFNKWMVEGGQVCAATLDGGYPFVKGSLKDVTAAEFGALFGPNGAFDSFYKKELASKVDTTGSPWKWKTGAGEGSGSDDGLRAFELADAIRTSFFSSANNALGFSFDVTPLSLSGPAIGVTLASDGQQVSYSSGVRDASRPIALTWPGNLGIKGAELSFQPPGNIDGTTLKRGLWALFRVVDAGTVKVLGPERLNVSFGADGRAASFEFRVDMPIDPFDLAALRRFHCPKAL